MPHQGDLDRESEHLLFHTLQALATVADGSDPYMAGHSARVAAYCERVAPSLGLSRRERLLLSLSASFHDIGFLSTPAYILRKPSFLAEDEMEEIRVHPVRGWQVFAQEPSLADIALAIRHHHERFDGSGYPDGLRGEGIPLLSRVILVAETYEAMTHHRAYRRAMSHDDALRRLQESAGSQLDPEVVKHFVAVITPDAI